MDSRYVHALGAGLLVTIVIVGAWWFQAPALAPATEAVADTTAELGPEALTHGPSAVVLGNPQGDVTVIEYFDYQCPVCRRVHPTIKQLAEDDEGIRIIHKHWPVFGAASVYASRLALAARWQDRYEEVHNAFMSIPGRLDEDKIRKAATSAGLDLAAAERSLDERAAEIDEALSQASAQAAFLRLQGTPGFVIGSYLIPGGLDLDTLKEIVADVRSKTREEQQ